MQFRPDFSIINKVDSVIITQKMPTKLLSDSRILVESRHVDDPIKTIFVEPSEKALQTFNRLGLVDPISCGKDNNANIRAFIMTSLQLAFNFGQTSNQQFFIGKIGKGYQTKTKTNHILNQNETLPQQGVIRIVRFLKTLANKKLKAPYILNLRNEFQQFPMMLNDLVITCRSILYYLGVQNSTDYEKKVKDNDVFTLLSKYFDIKYAKKKENFYIFEDGSFFIYKDSDEYFIGKCSHLPNREKKTNSLHIRKRSVGSLFNMNTKNKDKFYNIKCHYNHKYRVSELNNMEKPMISERNPANLHFNAFQKQHDKNESSKNSSTDRNYVHANDGIKEKDHMMFNGGSHNKTMQKTHFNQRINSPSHFNSFMHDKTFEWRTQDNRHKKAETVCHKACQTCHRRFYNNALQSNVLQVKISVDQKPKDVKISQNLIPTTLYFKNAPEFLNKKFNKKPLQGLVDSPSSKDQLLRIKTLQNQIEKQNTNSERSFQFNWLSKRQRVALEKQRVQVQNFPLSPKQVHSKVFNEEMNKFQSSKKSMSIHNLFLLANRDQQKSSQRVLYTPKQTGKSKTKQNRKLSTDSSDLNLKPKYFSALRSSKQLLSIKSKQKFVVNKFEEQNKTLTRPTTEGKLLKEKALQNTNNSTIKDCIHPERRATLNEKTRERGESSGSIKEKKEISPNNECSESIEEKMPRFIGKKKSLNAQLQLIMNN